jgi:hypothetical protein
MNNNNRASFTCASCEQRVFLKLLMVNNDEWAGVS